MLGILVTGPNASGKTTALQQAHAGYEHDPRLTVVYADNSDRSTFKGDALVMAQRMRDIWETEAEIVIVEGTRMPTIVERVVKAFPGHREIQAFVTLTQPETMEKQLRARCARLGKRFRDDYWKYPKLHYECQRRYRMSVPRFIAETAISWWDVDETYAGATAMSDAIRQVIETTLGAPVPVPPAVTDIWPRPGMLF